MNCYIKRNLLHVTGESYSLDELEYLKETDTTTQEKPQSVPSAPPLSASKGNPLPITNPIVPPIRNLQEKPSTPTQELTRKTTEEVEDKK